MQFEEDVHNNPANSLDVAIEDQSRKQYELCLKGSHISDGAIKFRDLNRILQSLTSLAQRATLLACGSFGEKGARIPSWLSRATEFKVTDLSVGSTKIRFDAPTLGSAASEKFDYQDLFAPSFDFSLGDSAIDLSCTAVQDALDDKSDGDRYDDQVLDAAIRFARAVESNGATLSLSSLSGDAVELTMGQKSFRRLKKRKEGLIPPSTQIISGTLDQITHSSPSFELRIDEKNSIPGHLAAGVVDTESMRSLWGKRVTVSGLLHFKRNGQPRVLVAKQILAYRDGDNYFSRPPSSSLASEIRNQRDQAMSRFDPLELAGKWPGNETISELLDELDRL